MRRGELPPIGRAGAQLALVVDLAEDELDHLREGPLGPHGLIAIQVIVAAEHCLTQVCRHRHTGYPPVRTVQVVQRCGRNRVVA